MPPSIVQRKSNCIDLDQGRLWRGFSSVLLAALAE
jgi:hypothetical protein